MTLNGLYSLLVSSQEYIDLKKKKHHSPLTPPKKNPDKVQVSDFAGPITELTFQRNQTNPELKRRRRVGRNSYKGPMDNNRGGGGWGKRAENCT